MNLETWLNVLVNGILLFILGLLIKPIADYLKNLIKEVKEFRGQIEELKKEMAEKDHSFRLSISQVHSLESRLWQEVSKLRRSVVNSSLVIRKRRAETKEILQEQNRTSRELESYKKHSKIAAQLLKHHNNEIDQLKSKIIVIGNEIKIFKNGDK